jgi:hypothetical protein
MQVKFILNDDCRLSVQYFMVNCCSPWSFNPLNVWNHCSTAESLRVSSQPKNVKTNSWNQVPVAPHASIWSQNYKVLSVSLKQDPRQVDRPSTKGKVLKKDVSLVTQPTRQHEGEPVYENICCGSL